ncbi:arabinogalactan protein 20 [Perilla frutescens var. hirtella]|nr:arabinogalactan protein 20 [Perilla frutescens var. hirtella]
MENGCTNTTDQQWPNRPMVDSHRPIVIVGIFAAFALVFAIFMPAVQGQAFAPAPAPTSDGAAIDQGIACVLMLLALVLTYIMHTFDAPLSI